VRSWSFERGSDWLLGFICVFIHMFTFEFLFCTHMFRFAINLKVPGSSAYSDVHIFTYSHVLHSSASSHFYMSTCTHGVTIGSPKI